MAVLTTCPHIETKRQPGESGWFCVTCGEKACEDETRTCGECRYIKPVGKSWYGEGQMYACRKLGHQVKPGHVVTFRVSEGTCFREKVSDVG